MPERPIQGDVVVLALSVMMSLRMIWTAMRLWTKCTKLLVSHVLLKCIMLYIGQMGQVEAYVHSVLVQAEVCWHWYFDRRLSVYILRREDMAGDARTIRRLMTVLTGLSIDTKSDFFSYSCQWLYPAKDWILLKYVNLSACSAIFTSITMSDGWLAEPTFCSLVLGHEYALYVYVIPILTHLLAVMSSEDSQKLDRQFAAADWLEADCTKNSMNWEFPALILGLTLM